jgi:hypothetical protein
MLQNITSHHHASNPIRRIREAREQVPEVCETCGQRIDRNSRDSIATPRHLLYAGKRKGASTCAASRG